MTEVDASEGNTAAGEPTRRDAVAGVIAGLGPAMMTALSSGAQAEPAHAGDAIPPQLLGTWRLVSSTLEEVPSGAKIDLFGPNPIGFINYGADGRMMVLQVRRDRPTPASAVPTAEEAAALFRSLLAYGGRFTVSGNKVTHHVDISWNQTWTGHDQVRFFRFDGNRVELSTEVSPDPVHGKMSVRRLVWEKIT
jgi:Lipocalin-like domain